VHRLLVVSLCADKPATVVVLKPVGDGLVPGVVTPQPAKVTQQVPQPSSTFVSPTVAASQPSQAAIIQKLLQGGAFVVGRLPNDNQPYLLPSSGVGLQPFQVVFGSAGAAKLPSAAADPVSVPAQRVVKSGTASADGMSDEAAVAASHLLAEESREVAEKKMSGDNGGITTLSTKGLATGQSLSQPAVAPVHQVLIV